MKKVLSLLTAVALFALLAVPLFTVSTSAALSQRTSNHAKFIMYFDNLTKDPDKTDYYRIEDGSRVGYIHRLAKLCAPYQNGFATKITMEGSGAESYQIPLEAGTLGEFSPAEGGECRYFSVRFMITDADSDGTINFSFQEQACDNYLKIKDIPYTVGEWKTLIVDTCDSASWAGGVALNRAYPAVDKMSYLYVSGLQAGNGFVLDYIGYFDTEQAANNEKAAQDAFWDTNKFAVKAPVFSVPSDEYSSEQTIEITTETEGASIYYTVDGSTPSAENGNLYESPLVLSANTTIKAIAVKEGMTESSVVTAVYTFHLVTATPIFSLKSGKYDGVQKVTISCKNEGAKIYYTTDGSEPSVEKGTLYNGEITISKTCILKAIAVCEGMDVSKTAGANYYISGVTSDTTPRSDDSETSTNEGEKPSTGCGSVIGIEALIAGIVMLGMAIPFKKNH